MEKKLFKIVLIILLGLICSHHLEAQSIETSGWFFLSHTHKIKDKWSYMIDVQIRSSSQFNYLQNVLIRPGLLYQITDLQRVGIGYTYFATWDRNETPDTFEPENRIFEQYVYESKVGRLSLNNRLRFEQRFIQKMEATIFAQRMRHQIQARFQLTGDTQFSSGLYLNLQNEIFVNVQNQDKINDCFFDQNRFYTGLGYRKIKQLEIELGYYFRYQIKEDSRLKENIIQLMIITNL